MQQKTNMFFMMYYLYITVFITSNNILVSNPTVYPNLVLKDLLGVSLNMFGWSPHKMENPSDLGIFDLLPGAVQNFHIKQNAGSYRGAFTHPGPVWWSKWFDLYTWPYYLNIYIYIYTINIYIYSICLFTETVKYWDIRQLAGVPGFREH